MGRRSRNRTFSLDDDPAAPPRPAPKTAPRTKGRNRPRQPTRSREAATARLSPMRKVIAAYLAAAATLGLIVLLGIGALGGTYGPPLVFLVALVGAVVIQRAAQRRLRGGDLTDEDRLMQTMAAGVLGVAVVLAFASAVVSLVV